MVPPDIFMLAFQNNDTKKKLSKILYNDRYEYVEFEY